MSLWHVFKFEMYDGIKYTSNELFNFKSFCRRCREGKFVIKKNIISVMELRWSPPQFMSVDKTVKCYHSDKKLFYLWHIYILLLEPQVWQLNESCWAVSAFIAVVELPLNVKEKPLGNRHTPKSFSVLLYPGDFFIINWLAEVKSVLAS